MSETVWVKVPVEMPPFPNEHNPKEAKGNG